MLHAKRGWFIWAMNLPLSKSHLTTASDASVSIEAGRVCQSPVQASVHKAHQRLGQTTRTWRLSCCLALSVMMLPSFLTAQSTKDVNAILSMCGCYDITFEFAETFSSDTAYEFHENYTASATEWVEAVEVEKGHISLQHLLTMGDYVVKHWRQDWDYQPERTLQYVQDRTWEMESMDKSATKKHWAQSVYQVDDSPRYCGTGTWVHMGDQHYWESESRRPLPRREYTKRSDYQVMDGLNRHEIMADGWVHEQDNRKVQFLEDGENVLVEEKGRNTYRRVPDENCQASIDYWARNAAFWDGVRDHWKQVFSANNTINMRSKVDSKRLYEWLFDLPETGAGDMIDAFLIQETSSNP